MKKVNKTLFLSLSLLLVGCNGKDNTNSTNNNESSDIINSDNVNSNETNSTTESTDSTTDNQESSDNDSSENNTSSTDNGSNPSIDNDNSNVESDDYTSDDETYVYFERQIKLYINPSVQYSNTYANNLGNEGVYMNSISNILVGMLNKHTNLIVYSNTSLPGKSLSESVKESNNLKVDYHLAIHSNAGGGKGSEGFYTKTSYEFTKSILDSMDKILPYKTRGAKYGQNELYELKNTTASASLIEILFHDDKTQALFIVNNQQSIAKAIFDGIVSYLS